MRAAVQPKYYSGDPKSDIMAIEISLLLDPDILQNETPEMLAFLQYLKEDGTLTIQMGNGRHIIVQGRDLAVDWPP